MIFLGKGGGSVIYFSLSITFFKVLSRRRGEDLIYEVYGDYPGGGAGGGQWWLSMRRRGGGLVTPAEVVVVVERSKRVGLERERSTGEKGNFIP